MLTIKDYESLRNALKAATEMAIDVGTDEQTEMVAEASGWLNRQMPSDNFLTVPSYFAMKVRDALAEDQAFVWDANNEELSDKLVQAKKMMEAV